MDKTEKVNITVKRSTFEALKKLSDRFEAEMPDEKDLFEMKGVVRRFIAEARTYRAGYDEMNSLKELKR